MFAVSLFNDQTVVALDEPFLREVAEFTLRGEGLAEAEISVAVLDDAAIHEINRQFLDHDCPTDVISFLLDVADVPETGRRIEGEIVISAETARRRGADFGWSPHDELVLYLVHGLLHLAGYDDQTPEDRTAMRTREQSVLAQWGLEPRYEEEGLGLRVQGPGPEHKVAVGGSGARLSTLDPRPSMEGEP